MNSAGKTFLAALILVGLLGVGWWAIDRPQPEPQPEPQQAAVTPIPKPDAALLAQIEAASVRLDGIVLSVDQMRLVSVQHPLTVQPSAAQASIPQSSSAQRQDPQTSESFWSGLFRALKAQLVEVVQVRRIEYPDALFLTPEQGVLVIERLRLRLLSARIALSLRQEKLFIQDLDQAEQLLLRAFDPEDPWVVRAKQGIREIRALQGRL